MSDHFVVQINIKSVKKPKRVTDPGARQSRWDEEPNADTPAGQRVIEDVLNLTTKAPELKKAIDTIIAHLEIHKDEEEAVFD